MPPSDSILNQHLQRIETQLILLREEDDPNGENVVAALEAERDAIAEQLAPFRVGDLIRLHDDDDDTPACSVVAVEYYTEQLEVSDPEVWDEVPFEPTYMITLDRMARSPDGHSEPDTYTADEIYLVDQ